MKTDVITVSSKGKRMESALAQVDKLAAYKGLSPKDALHLRVATRLSADEREQLLAASSTGKNESARGLMGRLRDFFDWSSDEDLDAVSNPLLLPDMFDSTSPTLDWEWSMIRYENALSARVEKNEAGAKEAWDELEKSVVKHVADDVKVSIRSGIVEMIIYKKLA